MHHADVIFNLSTHALQVDCRFVSVHEWLVRIVFDLRFFYTGLLIECLRTKMKCVQQFLEGTYQFKFKFTFSVFRRIRDFEMEHETHRHPLSQYSPNLNTFVKIDYRTRLVRILRVPLCANIWNLHLHVCVLQWDFPDSYQMYTSNILQPVQRIASGSNKIINWQNERKEKKK